MFACICVYVCACVNMRICVALGCRTKSRKKACECPTAYEYTTHTFYPHVLDPYICILLPFLLLCCSFHFSPLLSHLHPCTNTHTHTHVLSFTNTCTYAEEKTGYTGAISVFAPHRFLKGVHCYLLPALIK